MKRRTFLTSMTAAALWRPASAAAVPARYLLDHDTSVVGFGYVVNGQRINGRMPVLSADVMLDVDTPSQSHVSAVIDAAHANAGPFWAQGPMLGPQVLDVAQFPEIRFVSGRVEGDVSKARVTGALTVRGVTKETRLDAVVYRQRGTDAGDRSSLSILMTGRIDRRDFGATGYATIVAPEITLNILTRVTLAEAG